MVSLIFRHYLIVDHALPFRCEIDFRGSYFADLIASKYKDVTDLIMFSEDVTRAIEMEINSIEEEIMQKVIFWLFYLTVGFLSDCFISNRFRRANLWSLDHNLSQKEHF